MQSALKQASGIKIRPQATPINKILICLEAGLFLASFAGEAWGQSGGAEATPAPADDQQPGPKEAPRHQTVAEAVEQRQLPAPEAPPVAQFSERSVPMAQGMDDQRLPLPVGMGQTASTVSAVPLPEGPTPIATQTVLGDPEMPAAVPAISTPYSTEARDLRISTPNIPAGVQFSQSRRGAVASGENSDGPAPQRPAENPEATLPPSEADVRVTSPAPQSDSTTAASSAAANVDLTQPAEPTGAETEAGLPPLVTGFTLDGFSLSHTNDASGLTGLSFGEGRSTNFDFAASTSRNRVTESRVNASNLMTLTQSTDVWRTRSITQERQLTLTRYDPRTVLGQHLQATLTANCLGADQPQQMCTYTPGLVVDRDSIDPDTLLPGQIDQTARFGAVVTPASLAAIQQPGFQLGADDQQVGLDLYLPNVGNYPGNRLTTATAVMRDEQFRTTPTIGFSRVRQTIQANANTAAIARTVRGPAVVLDDDQPIANVILAAVSLLLPEASPPQLPGTEEAANPNVNQNLFLAANNTRLPENSLTLYQAGMGTAATPPAPVDDANQLPTANYNAIWLGLSPVTDRSYTFDRFFDPLGEQRVLAEGGGEGGMVDDIQFLSWVNQTPFSPRNLENAYTQLYITFFEQDVNDVSRVQQIDRIRYYPHLSFSGNLTGGSGVLRYYSGVITADTVQAYAGVDYQNQTVNDWSYRLAGIGYINPSYDRYSRLSGSLSRQFSFGEENTLQLGAGFNWALDQNTQRGDLEEQAQGSDVVAQARLNLGQVALGVTQFVGDLLPNSRPSRTALDVVVRFSESFSLAGYWSPFDQATSSPQAGVSANWRLGPDEDSPTLTAAWNNTRYLYGQDLFERELSTSADTFSLFLRMGLR